MHKVLFIQCKYFILLQSIVLKKTSLYPRLFSPCPPLAPKATFVNQFHYISDKRQTLQMNPPHLLLHIFWFITVCLLEAFNWVNLALTVNSVCSQMNLMFGRNGYMCQQVSVLQLPISGHLLDYYMVYITIWSAVPVRFYTVSQRLWSSLLNLVQWPAQLMHPYLVPKGLRFVLQRSRIHQ